MRSAQVSVSSTQHQGFFGEYPWHPVFQDMVDCHEPSEGYDNLITTSYFNSVSQYEWESGDTDFSLQRSLSIYLPSKTLVEQLGLSRSRKSFGEWVDSEGEVVYMDPSVNEEGPSFALVDTDTIQKWLGKNDMTLAWLIGGEKQLFTSYASKFYGRLVFSGLYSLDDDGCCRRNVVPEGTWKGPAVIVRHRLLSCSDAPNDSCGAAVQLFTQVQAPNRHESRFALVVFGGLRSCSIHACADDSWGTGPQRLKLYRPLDLPVELHGGTLSSRRLLYS